MVMKYRDKIEILAQILQSANGHRVRLTKIMYDTLLPHGMAKECLTLLIEKGLIKYLDGEKIFTTTEKGMNFLRVHNKLQELIPFTKNLSREKEMFLYL
jgi:predicted transcriptional regulator